MPDLGACEVLGHPDALRVSTPRVASAFAVRMPWLSASAGSPAGTKRHPAADSRLSVSVPPHPTARHRDSLTRAKSERIRPAFGSGDGFDLSSPRCPSRRIPLQPIIGRVTPPGNGRNQAARMIRVHTSLIRVRLHP